MLRRERVALEGGGGVTVLAVLSVLVVSSHPQQQQTTALEKQAWQHIFGGLDGFGRLDSSGGFGVATHPPFAAF